MNSINNIIRSVYRDTINRLLVQHDESIWAWYKTQYPDKTDNEIEELIQYRTEERRIEVEVENALHTELIKLDTLEGKIARLHSPDSRRTCNGCDLGEYAASGAEWPCRTWRLLSEC